MKLNPFQWIVWKLYIWMFVPKNLWYCDFHGKTVVVVPARIMEGHFRDSNNNTGHRKSRPFRHWTHVIGLNERRYELVFSDDPSYRDGVTQRRPSAVVGSLNDFRLFCGHFQVMRRSLHVPSVDDLDYNGFCLGQLDDPADMTRVIVHAKRIYSYSRRVLR